MSTSSKKPATPRPVTLCAALKTCVLDAATNFAFEVDGLLEEGVILAYNDDCTEFLLRIVNAQELEEDTESPTVEPPARKPPARKPPGTVTISAPTTAFLGESGTPRRDN